MDFIPIMEVFELTFLPTAVNICENVISAYCNDMISVFKLTKGIYIIINSVYCNS